MGVLKQLEQEAWAKDSPLKTVLNAEGDLV
jgi:hypothetical protein